MIQKARLAMPDVPEFKRTVRRFRSDMLMDQHSEEVNPKEQSEKGKRVASHGGYRDSGSPVWFTRIGRRGEGGVAEVREVTGGIPNDRPGWVFRPSPRWGEGLG